MGLRVKEILAIFMVALALGPELAVKYGGNADAGRPLPSFSLAQLEAAPPATLPHYIRLTGSIPHPELEWVFTSQGKTCCYSVFELPRTTADWHQGALIHLIEIDDGDTGNAWLISDHVEGKLSSVSLPPGYGTQNYPYTWRASVPVFILQRLPLAGLTPKADDSLERLMLEYACSFAAILVVWSLIERQKGKALW